VLNQGVKLSEKRVAVLRVFLGNYPLYLGIKCRDLIAYHIPHTIMIDTEPSVNEMVQQALARRRGEGIEMLKLSRYINKVAYEPTIRSVLSCFI
jgi:hypothetical protein